MARSTLNTNGTSSSRADSSTVELSFRPLRPEGADARKKRALQAGTSALFQIWAQMSKVRDDGGGVRGGDSYDGLHLVDLPDGGGTVAAEKVWAVGKTLGQRMRKGAEIKASTRNTLDEAEREAFIESSVQPFCALKNSDATVSLRGAPGVLGELYGSRASFSEDLE